ncbi:MAG: amidohydrolase [Lachnospiraceae bacterium]|nr:amidohydrolase [Lachnospiraceae bacterium]
MLAEEILQEASSYENEIISIRRTLHEYAEVGFDLKQTKAFVAEQLTELGYIPQNCGKAGIVATIGENNNSNKVFLLRADMDALPIQEESGENFACTNGNMHGCGHDMHTAMLLGAAKLLKKCEDKLQGTVKLMFQPAEELLAGSRDMIENGVLDNPKVDAGMMLHVLSGLSIKEGTVIVSEPGVSAPSADYFTINVKGKGCHGSMPQDGIDALIVAAHILIGLQELSAREMSIADKAIITIGSLKAGEASNVISDTAIMKGSIRAYDENLREYLKNRICDISNGIARAYRATAYTEFDSGAPTLINDKHLSESARKYLAELTTVMSPSGKVSGGGSEDFAYVSHKIPTIMVALAAGSRENGYEYPLHHPKVKFDENVLSIGSAVYAYMAIKYLSEE